MAGYPLALDGKLVACGVKDGSSLSGRWNLLSKRFKPSSVQYYETLSSIVNSPPILGPKVGVLSRGLRGGKWLINKPPPAPP